MFKLKLFVPLIVLLFLGSIAFGQEAPPAEAPEDVGGGYSPVVTEAVNLDEDIQPQDLGVGDPRILPDSPLYAFKNVGRGIQSFFTRDPVEKAELKLKFANEKIIEAKKIAEKTDQPEILNKVLDNYKTETDHLKKEVEKIKETVKENPDIDKFLDKFVDYNIKQQKLIGKLEKELPPDIYDKVKAIKEENLTKFSDIALKVAQPEILQEKLIKTIEQQPGSQFKNFKNLEVLKEIEAKVPEPAKDAIRQAQENALQRLQGDLEKMSLEDREKFGDYVKNIGGNETRHLEIIHQFETQEIPKIIRKEIEKAKERTFERIEKRMEEFTQERQKEEFLKHLERGKMEDLRIIKELENNLSPETIDKILEIKNKAMGNFKEDIEKADTPEKQEAFFTKMEEFHDVKQFEMFKEMDNVIPEEKKEFWEKMKEKAMEEMKRDVARTKDTEERRMKFEKLAGDMPQHIEIIKEFGPPPEIMQEIMKEQVERLGQKVENIEDAARLHFLKQRIEEEEEIKKELETRHPEIFQKIEERKDILEEGMTKEKASEQIEKAKQEIVAAENEFAAFDDKTKNEITQRSPYRVLLTNAQKKINVAQPALENELYGEAFGMATAAFHEANNARRIIKEIGLRREIFENKETERRNFEEKFFQESGEKKEEFEKQFKERFPTENIPLPGEFRAEFLPPEEILRGMPMPPYPGEPGQPAGEAPKPPIEGCACIQVWDPVCGKDGRTYGNACEAKCANVEIVSKGSCGEEKPPTVGPMPPISIKPLECTSDLSCPQPMCPPNIECLRLKCLEGKCISEKPEKIEELPCAKEEEKVNRNPLLGPTHQKCCEGLAEIMVSKSYSLCQKEIRREKPGERPSTGLPNPASVYCENLGYKLEIRTTEIGGQYGVCIFPDGSECEEWKFYRGECGMEYRKEKPAVCTQVMTYKKEGDKCFLCPDACSPIEKCNVAPLEKCEESYIKEGMPPLPAREESPFQFFKETFREIFKPRETPPIQLFEPMQPMQPSPVPDQLMPGGQPMPGQPMPGQPMQPIPMP